MSKTDQDDQPSGYVKADHIRPMLETAGQRLRWARIQAGFKTAKAAAKKAKVGEVSFRAYENDQHGFAKHAVKFAQAFGVTVEWLMEGDDSAKQDNGIYLPAKDHIEMVRKVDISYAMGDGSIVEDYPETEFLPFSLSFLQRFTKGTSDKLFIASGQGDSMEPTLRRDDLVMIDTAQNRIAMQDQIWALAYAGAGMIKRVRRHPDGRIELLSDNPSVPPIAASEDDLHVVGKVVWSARVM